MQRIERVEHAGRRLLLHQTVSDARAAAAGGASNLPAVLLVPGFLQNRRTFSLPSRDLAVHLARAGFFVVVVERDPEPPASGLHEHVEAHAALVESLFATHPTVQWVGHSMGGLMGVALPDEARVLLSSLITLGTPLFPALGVLGQPGVARAGHAVSRALGKRSRLFPTGLTRGFFQAGRGLIDRRWFRYPLQTWAPGHIAPRDLEVFLAESFTPESYAVFADLVELPATDGQRAGEIDMGERVASLDVPLLAIAGDLDGLAPAPAVRALFDRAQSSVKEMQVVGREADGASFGHVDLIVGIEAPRVVWPRVVEFLGRHASSGDLVR